MDRVGAEGIIHQIEGCVTTDRKGLSLDGGVNSGGRTCFRRDAVLNLRMAVNPEVTASGTGHATDLRNK